MLPLLDCTVGVVPSSADDGGELGPDSFAVLVECADESSGYLSDSVGYGFGVVLVGVGWPALGLVELPGE